MAWVNPITGVETKYGVNTKSEEELEKIRREYMAKTAKKIKPSKPKKKSFTASVESLAKKTFTLDTLDRLLDKRVRQRFYETPEEKRVKDITKFTLPAHEKPPKIDTGITMPTHTPTKKLALDEITRRIEKAKPVTDIRPISPIVKPEEERLTERWKATWAKTGDFYKNLYGDFIDYFSPYSEEEVAAEAKYSEFLDKSLAWKKKKYGEDYLKHWREIEKDPEYITMKQEWEVTPEADVRKGAHPFETGAANPFTREAWEEHPFPALVTTALTVLFAAEGVKALKGLKSYVEPKLKWKETTFNLDDTQIRLLNQYLRTGKVEGHPEIEELAKLLSKLGQTKTALKTGQYTGIAPRFGYKPPPPTIAGEIPAVAGQRPVVTEDTMARTVSPILEKLGKEGVESVGKLAGLSAPDVAGLQAIATPEAKFYQAKLYEILQKQPPAPVAPEPELTKLLQKIGVPTEAKPAPTVEPLKIEPEVERIRTRGVSRRIEQQAIEENLTKGFGDLPQYRAMSMREQAQKASDLLESNTTQAKRIAMGQEPPPEGVIPESVFEAVKMQAINENDIDTIKNLATNSKLLSEATTMGQRIKAYDTRYPDDPIRAIRDVESVKAETTRRRAKGKDLNKVKRQVVKEIDTEIKKVTPGEQEWADFIRSIEC